MVLVGANELYQVVMRNCILEFFGCGHPASNDGGFTERFDQFLLPQYYLKYFVVTFRPPRL